MIDLPDARGRYGDFGGRYVPETLMTAHEELERPSVEARADPSFQAELAALLRDFAGRPTPLYLAANLTRELGGAKIYLKREDLAHTGAHKINNAIGQGLLAKRLGKRRVIAETGAGQHGVATATICAQLGIECVVYMGEVDMERQAPNVFRMRLLGAEVRPGDQRGDHLLPHRQRRRRPPVPDDRARLPVGHRPRGEGAAAGARGPPARLRRRLRRRRQQRPRPGQPLPGPPPGAAPPCRG